RHEVPEVPKLHRSCAILEKHDCSLQSLGDGHNRYPYLAATAPVLTGRRLHFGATTMATIALRPTLSAPAPAARRISNGAIATYAAIPGMTFSASGAAPTPLYPLYQHDFALAPTALTFIFAGYAVALLVALLTVGSLSDHIGRRPVILGALLINVAAMVLFA